ALSSAGSEPVSACALALDGIGASFVAAEADADTSLRTEKGEGSPRSCPSLQRMVGGGTITGVASLPVGGGTMTGLESTAIVPDPSAHGFRLGGDGIFRGRCVLAAG